LTPELLYQWKRNNPASGAGRSTANAPLNWYGKAVYEPEQVLYLLQLIEALLDATRRYEFAHEATAPHIANLNRRIGQLEDQVDALQLDLNEVRRIPLRFDVAKLDEEHFRVMAQQYAARLLPTKDSE